MLNGISKRLRDLIDKQDKPTLIVILLAYLLLGFRLFTFGWSYTSKFLFWDQWDLVPHYLNDNFFKLLFLQHNEHHSGVGFVIGRFLEVITHWDTRFESLVVSLSIFLASIFAILIKQRLFKKLSTFDVVIPITFLTLYQWENLIWGFQIGFSLPLLWLLASVYLFTFKSNLWRNILLIILAFLSTYSALHGVFVGLLITIFFCMELLNTKEIKLRLWLAGSSLLTLLISASYFINYTSVPSLGQKSFDVIKYSLYLFLSLSNSVGISPKLSDPIFKLILIGLLFSIVFALIIGSFIVLVYQLKKGLSLSKYFSILALFIFTFLFALTTAYGRSGLGLNSAVSSRYITFSIPALFAVYLTLNLIRHKSNELILAAFLFFVIFLMNHNVDQSYTSVSRQHSGLENWSRCYLNEKDIERCNSSTGFQILQADRNQFLAAQLKQLEQHKLNIFAQKK